MQWLPHKACATVGRRGKSGVIAVLFISHSSQDDTHASSLEAWLRANGFTDLFIDHESIAGGDKWCASAGHSQ
jgi:hypothetical protein